MKFDFDINIIFVLYYTCVSYFTLKITQQFPEGNNEKFSEDFSVEKSSTVSL